jgi:hypothetical protein
VHRSGARSALRGLRAMAGAARTREAMAAMIAQSRIRGKQRARIWHISCIHG